MQRLNEINRILRNPTNFRPNQLRNTYKEINLNMNPDDVFNSDYVQVPLNVTAKKPSYPLSDRAMQERSIMMQQMKRKCDSQLSKPMKMNVDDYVNQIRHANSRQGQLEQIARDKVVVSKQQLQNSFINSVQQSTQKSVTGQMVRTAQVQKHLHNQFAQTPVSKIQNRSKYLKYEDIYYQKRLQEEYSRHYYQQLDKSLNDGDVLEQQRSYFQHLPQIKQDQECQFQKRIIEQTTGPDQDELTALREEAKRAREIEALLVSDKKIKEAEAGIFKEESSSVGI